MHLTPAASLWDSHHSCQMDVKELSTLTNNFCLCNSAPTIDKGHGKVNYQKKFTLRFNFSYCRPLFAAVSLEWDQTHFTLCRPLPLCAHLTGVLIGTDLGDPVAPGCRLCGNGKERKGVCQRFRGELRPPLARCPQPGQVNFCRCSEQSDRANKQ